VDESVEKILGTYEKYDEIMERVKIHQHRFVFDESKKEEFLKFVLE
jgi:hypothetical protein